MFGGWIFRASTLTRLRPPPKTPAAGFGAAMGFGIRISRNVSLISVSRPMMWPPDECLAKKGRNGGWVALQTGGPFAQSQRDCIVQPRVASLRATLGKRAFKESNP